MTLCFCCFFEANYLSFNESNSAFCTNMHLSDVPLFEDWKAYIFFIPVRIEAWSYFAVLMIR